MQTTDLETLNVFLLENFPNERRESESAVQAAINIITTKVLKKDPLGDSLKPLKDYGEKNETE